MKILKSLMIDEKLISQILIVSLHKSVKSGLLLLIKKRLFNILRSPTCRMVAKPVCLRELRSILEISYVPFLEAILE
jgi:hypothetical protein